ncbi:MAG: hypothetical protein ACRDP7_02355 [Trebonia sp.]
MSTEDRVRAATRARTELVGDIRPLEFPDELPARSRRARRARRARRWLTWGAPIGAAALVTALALVLVMLRQADGPQPGHGAPPAVPPAAASVPRYYVTLGYTGSTSSQMEAVVGDDQTGRKVAVIPPPAGQNFYGVTAAADDRTFVLLNHQPARQETTFDLLRVAPGAAHPAQLTELHINPLPDIIGDGLKLVVSGYALSPDGRELAVTWRAASTATNAVTQLSVYSLSSGALLDSWNTHAPNNNLPTSASLSWVNGDRSVDFGWVNIVPGPVRTVRFNGTTRKVHTEADEQTVRSLDVTAAGHDLLADSRLVMQLPKSVPVTKDISTSPCANALMASAGTLVCGSVGGSDISGAEACTTVEPTFASYSTATGKPLQVLYRHQGQCLNGQSIVLWTDPAGREAIVFLLLALKDQPVSAGDSFGVVSAGHFTPLAPLVTGTGFASGAADNPGGIAF